MLTMHVPEPACRPGRWSQRALCGCAPLLPTPARLPTALAGSNKLLALPASIGQLTALTSLDLAQNSITALPHQLCALTALDFLSLATNQLSRLPNRWGAASSACSCS